jgi:hypothetical protein
VVWANGIVTPHINSHCMHVIVFSYPNIPKSYLRTQVTTEPASSLVDANTTNFELGIYQTCDRAQSMKTSHKKLKQHVRLTSDKSIKKHKHANSKVLKKNSMVNYDTNAMHDLKCSHAFMLTTIACLHVYILTCMYACLTWLHTCDTCLPTYLVNMPCNCFTHTCVYAK